MKKCCKQCGEAKPLTAYRTYYNGGNSRYNVCTECEKINSRRKYLEHKSKRSEEEQEELLLIYQLYDTQREKGLAPPRQGLKERGLKSLVTSQLSKLESTNMELNEWLTKDLSEYDPDQLEQIYDDLQARYRPSIGIDSGTLLPIHDDTNREVLNRILVRFDDREEEYYGAQ